MTFCELGAACGHGRSAIGCWVLAVAAVLAMTAAAAQPQQTVETHQTAQTQQMAHSAPQTLLAGTAAELLPFSAGPGPASGAPRIESVAVSGQPFRRATRITIEGSSGPAGEHGLQAPIERPLRKGDVLWLSFKARTLSSQRETGESFIDVKLQQLAGDKVVWPPHIERGVSIGRDWLETSLPFVIGKDVPVGATRLVVLFDRYPQSFEIGPITLLNHGPNVRLADLPRSVVRYGGDEPGAAWRAAAAERIDKHRKAELALQVLDAAGRPVANAPVSVQLKRHAYHWGTAVGSDPIVGNSADDQQFRSVLARYFNQVVYENELKAKYWNVPLPPVVGFGGAPMAPASTASAGAIDRVAQIKRANGWLRDNGIASIRGHVLVWPSFRQTPPLARFKADPAALRAEVTRSLNERLAATRGEFDEWDVINEPYANHDVTDLLGRQEMVAWFKAARAGAPGVKLVLNDFTMFQGQGPGSPSQHFHDTARFLLDHGAPVDGIGEQAHIGGTPPPIPYVLERLDTFARLGLPIQITEFDINSNDDDFKSRYLRDFMTAVFSHPASTGIVQWGFWAGRHWFPVAALWDTDWTLRPHGKVYTELVTRTWHTQFEGRTDANGLVRLRGFLGDYEFAATVGGQALRGRGTLKREGATLVLRAAAAKQGG